MSYLLKAITDLKTFADNYVFERVHLQRGADFTMHLIEDIQNLPNDDDLHDDCCSTVNLDELRTELYDEEKNHHN